MTDKLFVMFTLRKKVDEGISCLSCLHLERRLMTG